MVKLKPGELADDLTKAAARVSSWNHSGSQTMTDQSAEITRLTALLDVARETMRDLRALYLAQKVPVAGSYAAAVIGAADEALAQITPGAEAAI